jgi:hypothetical protein
LLLVFLVVSFAASFPAAASLKQFDVFFGYDTIVPEGNWFPVMFEVQNDGPPFEAVFEVIPSSFARGQVRRMRVELPTGTRKRFVIPVFNSTRGHVSWDVVVRDSRGNKRDEKRDFRPKRTVTMQTPIVGAIPRTIGGLPLFPDVDRSSASLQPCMARIQAELFPDNPLALDGMAGLYLNAEKAMDLKDNQVNALLAWLSAGGHLVVGLHQPSDLQGSQWLRDLLPFEPAGLQNQSCQARLNAWLGETSKRLWTLDASKDPNHPGFKNLRSDPGFQAADLQVVTGKVREGQVVVANETTPLVVSVARGRGTVTVLTFSPETEPFRSWQHRKFFWAKLFDIPADWFSQSKRSGYYDYGGWSIDSVFGAITDSRQVRKLPVGWLLLLLLAYLAVIGPVDQYVLKKINRQMLTWLTFPAYVLLFSGLIYFIGYKLRAGDIEWNEFHVVDVIPSGGGAALRGHAFSSIYSPANARYPLESTLNFATLREEYAGSYGGGMDTSRSVVEQRGNNFTAEIAVPVWTSQLYVGDWWHAAKSVPITAEAIGQGNEWEIKVQNNLAYKVSRVAIVFGTRLHEFEGIPARDSRTFKVNTYRGQTVVELAVSHAERFYHAASYRRSALGGGEAGSRPKQNEIARWTVAASFANASVEQQNYRRVQAPRGFDLTAQAMRGDLIVFALVENQTLVNPMNYKKFSARRTRMDTLIRLAMPMKKES